jgi:hypothetical protein
MFFRTLLLSTLLASSLLANQSLTFVNTNIEWSLDTQGHIISDSVIFNGRNYNVVRGSKYELFKDTDNQLIAKLPEEDLNVGISVGKNLKKVITNNLNFILLDEKNSFSLQSFSYTDINNKTQSVENLRANCSTKSNNKSLLSIIFSSCFNNGDAKIGMAAFPGIISAEDVSLKVLANKFQLNGKLIDPIQGSAKIKGISNFDLENNELVIEVQSAKLEFINIRSRLFKELGKIKSKKIKVKEPFIIISFK